MSDMIEICYNFLNFHNIKNVEIPNIVVTYNNKIISLVNEFRRAGIDFYDSTQCESSIVIELLLQNIIAFSLPFIKCFINKLTISKEQIDSFVNSYKKPTLFKKIFMGATYAPKKSILTPMQQKEAILFLEGYKSCDNKIYNFSLKDIDTAIDFYKRSTLDYDVSESDLNARIEKIYTEVSLLGYKI